MFSPVVSKQNQLKINLENPRIEQLGASLKHLAFYEKEKWPAYLWWIKKLESFMSIEAVKLRNKPNRATKIAATIKGLMGKFKLLTCELKSDEVVKLFPTLSLITSNYLNLVVKSTMRNKRTNRQLALDIYCFVKSMLHESPEYILDTILTSSIGENCAVNNSFEHMVLEMVIHDKFVYDSDPSCLMKYLCIVTLLKECGCDIAAFYDVTKRYPKFPSNLCKFLKTAVPKLDIKTGEHLNLNLIVNRMHSRQIIPLCRRRLYVISLETENYENSSDECDSDDTVSMIGDDDAEKVTSTNPIFEFSVKPQDFESDSDAESDSSVSATDSDCRKEVATVESEEEIVETHEEVLERVSLADLESGEEEENSDREQRQQLQDNSGTNQSLISDDDDCVYEGTKAVNNFERGRDQASSSSDENEKLVPIYTPPHKIPISQDEDIIAHTSSLAYFSSISSDNGDEDEDEDHTGRIEVDPSEVNNIDQQTTVETETVQNISTRSKRPATLNAKENRTKNNKKALIFSENGEKTARNQKKRKNIDGSEGTPITRARSFVAATAEITKIPTKGARVFENMKTEAEIRRSPRTPPTSKGFKKFENTPKRGSGRGKRK